ncbi:unnamed protein product [Rotaria sp. Silwood2]|nr:unnamed protein product [Rotaria sp. Silwood2]
MPQQLVRTKEQKIDKTHHKSCQSEESFNESIIRNFSDNLGKQREKNSVIEKLPRIPDKDGSDQSIWRNTFSEILNLYKIFLTEQVLKAEDKDQYLPSKFLQFKNRWYLSNIIESLFIDRMIADIFLKISKTQRIHDNIVRALMNSVDSLENMEKKIFGDSENKDKLIEAIRNRNRSADNRKFFKFFQDDPLTTYKFHPSLVSDMANRIYNNSFTNPEKLKEIISLEVSEVRCAAIEALYCSVTKSEATLSEHQLKQIELFQNENDEKFKKFVIKIMATFADSNKIDCNKLFKLCLENLENNVNVEESAIFIHQQCKDDKKCKILFNEYVISRISSLLNNNSLNDESKLYCCMTINKYLERSCTKGLNEIQLKNCIYLINDQNDNVELKKEALNSILLTASKDQNIPEFIIGNLIENIDKFNEILVYFAAATLEVISRRQLISKINQLSFKLLDDRIPNEESNILFCRNLLNNSDCPSISSIVAKIFVNTLKNNNLKLSKQTLEHLIRALSSSDKQTQIFSAKSLYLARDKHDIHNDHLIELKDYVDDEVPDVSVYSTVVYAQSLAKLSSSTEEPIMKCHLELLPKIYAFGDLQLDEENFTDIVHENIISVLFNQCKKTIFEDNIFSIFDHILMSEGSNRAKVIQIIDNYTGLLYPIPEKTISVLDSVIEPTETVDQEVLNIFKNLIRNRQKVSEKILCIFANNLFSSDNDRLREESFCLLDTAKNNQHISDKIYDIFELERICISNALLSFDDDDDIIQRLYEKAKEGKTLTTSGWIVLSRIIDSQSELTENLITLLLNISSNKQVIPDMMIDRLVKNFDPKQTNCTLIKLFENLIKNHQNVSKELLIKLENAFDNESVSDDVSLIFVLLGQKGKNLSSNIIKKISNKFLTINKSSMMQQYLSFFCLLIEKESIFFKEGLQTIDRSIQKALIHALRKGNQTVIRKSVDSFNKLLTVHRIQLISDSVDALLEKVTNVDCDKDIKQEINQILIHLELNHIQKHKLQLSNVSDNANEFLDKLNKKFLLQLTVEEFRRIDTIINNCPNLINRALETLLKCLNKKDIVEQLLSSITVLLESTSNYITKELCIKLIIELAKVEKTMPNPLISLIVAQDNIKLANDALQIIKKIQPIPKEYQDRMNLLLQLNNINSIVPTNLEQFLKTLREELEKGLILSNSLVDKPL